MSAEDLLYTCPAEAKRVLTRHLDKVGIHGSDGAMVCNRLLVVSSWAQRRLTSDIDHWEQWTVLVDIRR